MQERAPVGAIGNGSRSGGAAGAVTAILSGDLETGAIAALLVAVAGVIGSFARDRAHSAPEGSFERLGWQILGLLP